MLHAPDHFRRIIVSILVQLQLHKGLACYANVTLPRPSDTLATSVIISHQLQIRPCNITLHHVRA